jgi:hypothetical protein
MIDFTGLAQYAKPGLTSKSSAFDYHREEPVRLARRLPRTPGISRSFG